jgi:hypothetical protein
VPATAVAERGAVHNELGNICDDANDIDRALHHYRQCIQYAEKADDIFEAGKRRGNVAITLLQADRVTDAPTPRPQSPTSGPSATVRQVTSKRPNACPDRPSHREESGGA